MARAVLPLLLIQYVSQLARALAVGPELGCTMPAPT